ncbi:histidine triad nucleotide-binding protein [Ectothiorhodospiraceae bacterium WFHF3C12]|nr:histidine triad nucleotide-binding protein [Ectothiorhodospiraceae bacterium WFHF3C12]
MSECVFCRIAEGRASATILHEDDQLLAFRDINPQAPTHILVIPREHVRTLDDLEDRHAEIVGRMHLVAQQVARELGIAEDGYRTVFNCRAAAGQSVFHIHLHLLGGRRMHWPPG